MSTEQAWRVLRAAAGVRLDSEGSLKDTGYFSAPRLFGRANRRLTAVSAVHPDGTVFAALVSRGATDVRSAARTLGLIP